VLGVRCVWCVCVCVGWVCVCGVCVGCVFGVCVSTFVLLQKLSTPSEINDSKYVIITRLLVKNMFLIYLTTHFQI